MQFHCLQPSASIGRPPRAKCYGSLQARQISGRSWSRAYISGRTGRLMNIDARPESRLTGMRSNGESWKMRNSHGNGVILARSEEHTSELQSLMRISYAVFCLKKKTPLNTLHHPSVTYPIYHVTVLIPHTMCELLTHL